MLMPTIHEVLALLPPVLLGAAVILAVAVSPWRKVPFALDAAGAAAFAAAFFWGYRRLAAWPDFPPLQLTERVVWTAAAAALMAMIESPLWKKPAVAPFVRIPTIALLLAWLLSGEARRWTAGEAALHYGAFAAAIFAAWYVIKESAAHKSALVLIGLSSVIGVFGLVVGNFGSVLLGQLCGTLSMMCGAAVPFVFFLPRAAIGRGAVAVVVTAFSGLLLNAHLSLYEPPPARVFLLFAAAPFGFLPILIPALRARFPRAVGFAGLGLTLLLAGLAFYAAKGALPPPSDDPYASMYK